MNLFWTAFAYGFVIGLAFWCRDVLMKEWRARAAQPGPG